MSGRFSRTIYVGNLPADIRESEIEDIFYKVRVAYCGRSVCQCDVQMMASSCNSAYRVTLYFIHDSDRQWENVSELHKSDLRFSVFVMTCDFGFHISLIDLLSVFTFYSGFEYMVSNNPHMSSVVFGRSRIYSYKM
ncbi:hypothetical protein BUALT_Bualt01G0084700 [Buddleja alternifolia]|uniref:RRM domain-containing protein n=1 Tax=Buddleja alternifolia TaxID=168488 RepID=A0AAV6YC32_9LAMI|nr:hypothetical protein BUALT_Bualt01G0084700 [Buddleja alternifolia]